MGWYGGGGGGMGGGMGGGGGGGWGAMRNSLAMSDEDIGKVFEWGTFKRLIAYIRPYKKRAAGGIVAMIFLQTAQVAQPYLPGRALDAMRSGDTHALFVVVALLAFTAFVGWMAAYQQSYQMARVGQFVLYDLASDMFKHIASLSLSFFDRNETGRIMARVQSDVTVLQNFMSQGMLSTLGNALGVFGILAVMFTINWRLAALTSTAIPVFACALFVWQSFSRRAFRQARATISVVNSSLQENVSGVRVIQSMGREVENSRRFDQANTRNLEANLDAGRVAAAAQPIVEFTSAMSMLLVLLFGGRMVIHHTLTIGELLAFTLYVDRFFDPIRIISQQYNQLQRSSVAAERIFEILDTEREIKDAPDALELPRVDGRVTYDHVQFAYVPDVYIFKDLNLDIQPGERVALVGQTGAGKSTIVSMLMRFYDVTGGAIRIDGHDIRDVTIRSLRQQIGIVLQDPVLFSGSIAHNIRYSRPDATDAEVEQAAHDVGLHEQILKMDDGYETLVNERGIGLSIGQRQLISFARVLIADPRILILDEATASLDTATELVVQAAIKRITEGRTAIMIAHRLSTIRDADRIIVLEHGAVIEEGNHAQLMGMRGAYYRFYAMGFRVIQEAQDETAPVAADEALAAPEQPPATAG